MEIRTKLSQDWITIKSYWINYVFIKNTEVFYTGTCTLFIKERDFKEEYTQEDLNERFREIVSSIKR